MLGFNLRKRLVNTFVKLQFHHVYGVSRFKRNVDATFGGVLLNINSEIGKQGKYNIKHLPKRRGRLRKKILTVSVRHVINIGCFINIKHVFLANAFKSLYSDGI